MKTIQELVDAVDNLPDVPNPNRVQAQRGRKHSAETREKMSLAQRGKKRSLDARARMSEAQRGKTLSQETKAKLSASITGRFVGYEHSRVTCPHCGSSGGATSMGRWHFERCQFKDSTVLARFEAAFKTGPKKTANHRVSWKPAAVMFGIDARALVAYVEHIRAFIRSKK